MRNLFKSAVASAIGAVAMYYLDPERGYRRRALMRDRIDLFSRDASDFMHVQGRRAADQVRDLGTLARRPFSRVSGAFDYPLVERARARARYERLMSPPTVIDHARASMAGMSQGPLLGMLWKVTALCAASAAAMYYLDPDMGRRRRALVRDKFNSVSHGASDYARTKGKLAAERVKGMAATARAPFAGLSQPRSDRQLCERIRSELGRVLSHPKAVEVRVNQGHVSLHGHVLAAEVDTLLSTVQGMPGVQVVDNRLEVHQEAGNIPALQGGEQAAWAEGSRSRKMLPFVALAAPLAVMVKRGRAARRARDAGVWH